ncbi:hypothetical protein pEaSNUABM56_00202 [Erwinia phage pEa_SNUABM_56]|nr:hypothetical protein pEaSNUABM55_00130 [Erwinia phage pEa_SNUABM_55]UYL85222.1 hypothetical protein pEaSNUABM56_00202 [Erwinia phage pEa_SNUABM_56]
MIDQVIMEAVLKDEAALGVSSTRPNYIVMTGLWRMLDDDQGNPWVICTDDYRNPDQALNAAVLPECEIIDGERLVMYTAVQVDDLEFSLVLIKSKVYTGDSDETDVG